MEVNPGSMDVEKISELINRRRRQILVHSIIYYKMDAHMQYAKEEGKHGGW